MLCNGHGNTRYIDLLEGVLAKQRKRHIAGDGYHGNGVHICCGNTSYEIGGARTAGGEADAYLSGGTGIPVGSMGSALLMTGQYMMNLILMLV